MAAALIKDQGTETLLALVMIAGGAALLYDAHERRGVQRPFWLRLFGGWV
jgi:hypothetical protein